MGIEDLVHVVTTDKVLRRIWADAPDKRHELLNLYASEAPEGYEALFRSVLWGLYIGNGFTITLGEDQSELQSALFTLDDLSDTLGFQTDFTENTVDFMRATSGGREKHYSVPSRRKSDFIGAMLHEIYGTEDDGLNLLLADVKKGGEVTIHLDLSAIRRSNKQKKAPEMYADGLAKKLDTATPLGYEVELNRTALTVRRKQYRFQIDLGAYARVGVFPGRYAVRERDLAENYLDEASDEDVHALLDNDFGGIDYNQALLLAKLDHLDEEYASVGSFLSIAKASSEVETLAQAVEDEVYMRIVSRRAEIRDIVRSVNLQGVSLDWALSTLSERERNDCLDAAYATSDKSNVRGILGEVISVALMKTMFEERGELLYENPGTRISWDDSSYFADHGYNGYELSFTDGNGGKGFGVDGLVLYHGVPVVFEAKTGAGANQSWYDLVKSGMKSLYGLDPIVVQINIRNGVRKDGRNENWFVLETPGIVDISERVEEILGGNYQPR